MVSTQQQTQHQTPAGRSRADKGQPTSRTKQESKLLVGVDVYNESDEALTTAFNFATLVPETRLDIVWAPPIAVLPAQTQAYTGEATDPQKLLRQRVARALDETRREALHEAGTRIVLHIVDGVPAQALAQLAFMLGSDMIVVGAQDKGKIEEMLLGSTSKKLVRDAPCPVLVARPKSEEALPEVEEKPDQSEQQHHVAAHTYHAVPRNVKSQENMPLLFPMDS